MSVMPVSDQAPEVQEQSVEDRIAARFGETPQEQPAEAQPADDLFELDWEDGQKYRVPSQLKDGFLRQKDYTQKTQETAELRKTYEQASAVAQQSHLDRAFNESIGQEQNELSVIDAYLSQMSKVDWGSMDTGQILKTKIELDNIKERRASIKESIADKRSKFDTDMKARMSELRSKTKEQMSKSLNGFSEEAEKSMRSYAASVGLTENEIDTVLMDPRSFRVIHDGMQFQKVQASAANPVTPKPNVLSKGPTSERMPPEVIDRFNYQKAIKKATTRAEVNGLIEGRLTSMFAKRK